MIVRPLHLLYMSQGVDFCWGAYIFCLIEKFSKKNWECYTRSGEKKGWVNSSFITHGTFLLPHSWLSSCDEIKIPHSRLRRSWGIFFSSRLLSHLWGSKNVPFVIHEELFFPHSSLRDSWGKNPSLFLSRPGMAQTLLLQDIPIGHSVWCRLCGSSTLRSVLLARPIWPHTNCVGLIA